MRKYIASFLVVCLAIVGIDVNFNESRASLKAVAGLNQAAVAITGGTISGVTISSSTLSSPTFTGTVTASQVTGIERVLAQWGVPCILASSGTMGNNGAISGMTALPRVYSGGAWLYLPAGAVAAGVPSSATYVWFVASSTTAGTVYNSTWDGTGIPALGTTTAYSTTGPGAFTGISSGQIVTATVTIPANAMGPNGTVRAEFQGGNNTAAGNKIFRIRYAGAAGTIYFSATQSTSEAGIGRFDLQNQGVAASQVGSGFLVNGAAAITGSIPVYGSVDSTASGGLVFSMEKATATNHVILEGATVKIAYGS